MLLAMCCVSLNGTTSEAAWRGGYYRGGWGYRGGYYGGYYGGWRRPYYYGGYYARPYYYAPYAGGYYYYY